MTARKIVTVSLAISLLYTLLGINYFFAVPASTFGLVSKVVDRPVTVVLPKTQAAKFTSSEVKENPYSILFTGDVMLARNVEYLIKKNGLNYPFIGVNFDDLSKEPYVVGNFEAAVPETHKQTEALQLNFSVNAEYLAAAKIAGFTHFSLANNHSYDFEGTGYKNTFNALETNGLEPFGHPKEISNESVSFLNVADNKIAVIGLHTLTKKYTSNELEALFSYAKQRSDFQIVYIHWGVEYSETSSKAQKDLAKKLVSLGSDLIIGHHPHVVQEVQLINGVPVFYSLGNYIFDQYFSTSVQEGLLLSVDFSSKVSTVSLLPITSVNNLSSPEIMDKDQHSRFLENLADKSDSVLEEKIKSGVLHLYPAFATSTKIAMIDR